MDKLKKLQDTIESMKSDFAKFYLKGNAAAGTRIRLGMQEVKNQASEIRIEIQTLKKSNEK